MAINEPLLELPSSAAACTGRRVVALVEVWISNLVYEHCELVYELIWREPHIAGEPCADGLANATDCEVRRRFDTIVWWLPQKVGRMLAGQHREYAIGLSAFAYDHGVGQLRIEQQTPDAGITGDSPDDVDDPGAVLFTCRRGGHCSLTGSSDIGHHRIEDATDEFVLVGEAFVEVAGGEARPLTYAAHG